MARYTMNATRLPKKGMSEHTQLIIMSTRYVHQNSERRERSVTCVILLHACFTASVSVS